MTHNGGMAAAVEPLTTADTRAPVPPGRRPRLAAWAILGMTAIGLLNFAIVMTSELADRGHPPAAKALVWEMTGAYAFLLFVPLLVAFMARYPLRRGTVLRRLPLHAAMLVTFSVLHTLLMWGSRTVIYAAAGWARYDYGDMRYRFPMEGLKQVFGYALLFLLVTLVGSARRERERAVAAARLEQQLAEARLAALKLQLNPHFLFNTLNMISSYIGEDPKVADAMVTHLSDFLRATLRHADVQEVRLEQELEFLESYLAIMKARFEERLQVAVDVPQAVRRALVPHLLLQPLVENSVTHSMADPARAGMIHLSASGADGRLVLTVTDNGPGLAAAEGDGPRRGVGLSNTAERLRHLYGTEYRLTLDEAPGGGVRVTVEIPWRTAPDGGVGRR
jgi:two-component system, LytTR family, sensor kinase